MQRKTRVRDKELNLIIEAFRKNFTSNDHLWLFGSRVDFSKRGGDIDLYIETVLSRDEATTQARKLVIDAWNKIGEQKIDVVLNVLKENKKLAIYKIAQEEGVQLV